jgi:hypothetical protein
VEQVLSPKAINTTEERYENYLQSTDFINTVIFPGSCCPSLHALVDAAYRRWIRESTLYKDNNDDEDSGDSERSGSASFSAGPLSVPTILFDITCPTNGGFRVDVG